jgi:hypothetical protein
MKISNWIVTVGKATTDNNNIKYVSETVKNELNTDEIMYSIIRSNVFFDNGKISFKVKSKNKFGRCQIIFNYGTSPTVIVGLNPLQGLYGIAMQNSISNLWEAVSITGSQETFNTNVFYSILIKVEGSIIEMYVNDVLVAQGSCQIFQSQITFFLSSLDNIEVKDLSVEVKKPKVFVVMQFTDEYNNLYKEVIRPVSEAHGYTCERVDEFHNSNPILNDIIQSIRESSVVIADITPITQTYSMK